MDELKDCPFCGGKAYLFVNDGVRVLCGTCGASTNTLVDEWYGGEPNGSAVKAVIEKWNRRVNRKMEPFI